MRFLILAGICLAVIVAFILVKSQRTNTPIKTTLTEIVKPYEQYSFENLRKRGGVAGEITIDKKPLKETDDYSSYLFFFTTNGKKVSGMLNIPKKDGVYPVIEMNRGYAEQAGYETGNGTKHAGEVFAQNGFITIAPDFLGYGSSDKAPSENLEERFLTYTTAMDLLASIPSLNEPLSHLTDRHVQADTNHIGMWGHSNGGNVTLSTLAITGKAYPTSLWNPVSKPFPFSVLVYTDDFDDHGKALRKVIADFEKDYDIEKYSPTNYYQWITAPIQLHQGEADEQVLLRWSNQLDDTLKKQGRDITYYTYPGDDHNFTKGNWQTVVDRDIAFYTKLLKSKSRTDL